MCAPGGAHADARVGQHVRVCGGDPPPAGPRETPRRQHRAASSRVLVCVAEAALNRWALRSQPETRSDEYTIVMST
jgi:hypothetical protein